MQHESVYPIKASMIGAGSTKNNKALNRRMRWGETGILNQHDPRHVDVLVESPGIENGNTVQTPMIDDVTDENAVWLDSEQISNTDLTWPGDRSSPKTGQTKRSP